MRLRGKQIHDLTIADVEALIEVPVGESKTVEFKQSLPEWNEQGKKDLLSDVSALANTNGGVIVYGMGTKRDSRGSDTGIADRIAPLSVNPDVEKQRILNLLHDGVAPSLGPHVAIASIACEGGCLLVLGVLSSRLGPHMVVAAKRRRIYRRSDVANYEPDVTELRRMFLEATESVQGALEFRDRRLARILSGHVHVPSTTPACIVHVVPLGGDRMVLDLSRHGEALKLGVPPFGYASWWGRFNADGHINYASDRLPTMLAYSQCLRSGGYEGFDGTFAGQPGAAILSKQQFSAVALRHHVSEFVGNAVRMLEGTLSVEAPFLVMVTLLRVYGYRIAGGADESSSFSIDASELYLPEIVLEPGAPLRDAMVPAFDALWQASGIAQAPPL